MKEIVSTDFFVVPTATFHLLFVFLVLSHDRRRVVHFTVTSHPTAEWTAQQLLHAFPWDTAPRHLLSDRDGSYGERFRQTAQAMGIHEVLTTPRSPWQNAYVERLIGSIRRECLDHVMIFGERGLHAILKSYFDFRFIAWCCAAQSTPFEKTIRRSNLGKNITRERTCRAAKLETQCRFAFHCIHSGYALF